MVQKQIYASVQIADHEVRLVVGEFHENHLNILRVERVKHNGVQNQKIIQKSSVISSLTKACENVSSVLGYKIERVLLVVPSIQMKRVNGKVNVDVASGKVQLSDIQRGINEIVMSDHDEDLELVNVGGIKYIINGISSRKLPLNEECDHFTMDLDLFYCEKNSLYAYADVVEKAGLEIMDICLNSYAIGEEAALFEQAISNYIILIDLERQTTTLSLFSHGKLLNSEVLEEGYGEWASAISNQTGLKSDTCVRLLVDNAVLKKQDYSNDVIFLWANDSAHTLSLKQLHEMVVSSFDAWLDKMKKACEPIVSSSSCQVIVTGSGVELAGIKDIIGEIATDTSIYVPQTIGARDGSLTSVLGMFYAWKQINQIRNSHAIVSSEQAILDSLKPTKKSNDETGFTKKLMNIIMNEK